MKRTLVVIGIWIVAAQVGFAQSPASQPSAVKLDAAEHNFGKVWAGATVTHTFRFTNASDKPIAIKNVSTSCGCTTTKDYARTVAPGAAWELAATFNTKGQRGTVSKKITVVTDAAGQPNIIFTIAGEVATRYKAEPNPSFIFGRIKGDAPETRTLTITSQIDTPLILSKAAADTEQFFVDLKEIEKGKKYEIAVATIPPLKEGTTTGKVIVETNVPEEPKIELYVSAIIPSRLALTPPMVSMPESRSNDTKTTATLRMYSGDTIPISCWRSVRSAR